jgi:hypothetical protein
MQGGDFHVPDIEHLPIVKVREVEARRIDEPLLVTGEDIDGDGLFFPAQPKKQDSNDSRVGSRFKNIRCSVQNTGSLSA